MSICSNYKVTLRRDIKDVRYPYSILYKIFEASVDMHVTGPYDIADDISRMLQTKKNFKDYKKFIRHADNGRQFTSYDPNTSC